MLRVIGEIQPAYVVAENVYGIYNQESGVVFETLCSQMEDKGYEVQPIIIPACAIGAQIRRDRIWFVGHFSFSSGIRQSSNKEFQSRQQHNGRGKALNIIDPLYSLSSTEYRRGESTFSGGVDGLPGELAELNGFGNAVNPQVVFEIFKSIASVATQE